MPPLYHELPDGRVELPDPSMLDVVKEIWKEDVYRVKKRKGPRGVVIDAGGNVGLFARFAVAIGATKVISVEPDPNHHPYFRKNVPSDRVILDKRALYYDPDDVFFYRGRDPRFPNVNSTIVDPDDYPIDFIAETVTMEQLLEDHALDHVWFMKMDIENAEYNIFANIKEETLEKIDNISIETHSGCTKEEYGVLIATLTTTHHVEILGSYERGCYVYARRYGRR